MHVRRHYIKFPQHLDKICRSARTNPIVGVVMVLECVEKAEGVEHVWRRLGEMIAVILDLQALYGFFACCLESLSKVIDIVGHGSEHLLRGYTAHSSIVGAHGYVLQVVKLAEYAELRELGDAGEENKLEIWIAVFQRRVEISHHIAQYWQCPILMHYIKQRSVILVD